MRDDSATAVVNARGATRIRNGHPWVFRPDVIRGPERDAGDGGPALVRIEDARGKSLGIASWAARARLALRRCLELHWFGQKKTGDETD